MWTDRRVAEARREPGSPFRVLAVCTGNICRSPAVERLLRATFDGDPSIRVASAGTQALVGHRIADPMAELLVAQGADPAGFAARQLTSAIAADADLVLALTREHRSAVVALHPRALRRTFTLRELAALVRDLPPHAGERVAAGTTAGERLEALVAPALALRPQVRRAPEADDVVDPWRRSAATYRESMTQITAAIEAIAAVTRV